MYNFCHHSVNPQANFDWTLLRLNEPNLFEQNHWLLVNELWIMCNLILSQAEVSVCDWLQRFHVDPIARHISIASFVYLLQNHYYSSVHHFHHLLWSVSRNGFCYANFNTPTDIYLIILQQRGKLSSSIKLTANDATGLILKIHCIFLFRFFFFSKSL